MGLNVHIHENRVVATAGPVRYNQHHKLKVEHEKIVSEMMETVPHLNVTPNVSDGGLTRLFTIDPLTPATRLNVGAMAEASHQRLDATGLEWGGGSG